MVGGADPERKVRMTATAPSQSRLPNPAPLLDLLDRQVEICLELERHSADLLERLSKAQCDDAAALLASRQPLVDEISTLNVQFASRCPSWPDYLTTLSSKERERANTVAGRLDDLLNRVRTIDALLSERLGEVKQEISHALGELLTGKHSNRAYVTGTTATTAPGRNRFMDERG